MLLGGDELGRTQSGNNNAYCQDDEISWYDWGSVNGPLLEFSSRLIAFRRAHPVFRRRRWFQDRPIHGQGTRDIAWFTPEGVEMTEEAWASGMVNALGIWMSGAGLLGSDYEPVPDDTFYVIISSRDGASSFRLPSTAFGDRWKVVFDTDADPSFPAIPAMHPAGAALPVESNSVILLRRIDVA